MKSIIYKLVCEFSEEKEMEFYSENSIEKLIAYLENLTKKERQIMAQEYRRVTSEMFKLINPKTNPHKTCNDKILKLEIENAELRNQNIELRNQNIELRNDNVELRAELNELKLLLSEHLETCKSR